MVTRDHGKNSTRVARQFLNCINHFLLEYFISPKATCPFVLR